MGIKELLYSARNKNVMCDALRNLVPFGIKLRKLRKVVIKIFLARVAAI